MAKGVSAGAVFVFLMAGPATNASSIAVVKKILGKKIMFLYLFLVATISIFFGILFLVELLFLFRTEFVFIDIFQEGGIKNLAEFTFSATSEADVNNALGLSTNIKNIGSGTFTLYPNPAKDSFIINFPNKNNYQISIYTITGLLVKRFSFIKPNNRIFTNDLSAGCYIIELTSEDESQNIGIAEASLPENEEINDLLDHSPPTYLPKI